MLSILLCTGRAADMDDFTYTMDGPGSSPPRKKATSLGSGKRKVAKLQIGAPSDFRHESHMGYDEVAGLDIDRYQQEFQMMAQPPSPTTVSGSQTREIGRTPSGAVKRKPVPSLHSDSATFITDGSAALAYVAETSTPPTTVAQRLSVSRSPVRDRTRSRPQQRNSVSGSGSSPVSKKPLVPLLGESSGGSDNAYYVTQTAKIRFEGAMAEIENALKAND